MDVSLWEKGLSSSDHLIYQYPDIVLHSLLGDDKDNVVS